MADFGLSYPLGYKMVDYYRDRWFRIHSFSCSKRGPDTEDEHKSQIARHLEVALKVIGRPSQIFYAFDEDCVSPPTAGVGLSIPGIGARLSLVHLGRYSVALPFDDEEEIDLYLEDIAGRNDAATDILHERISLFYQPQSPIDFMTIYSSGNAACYCPYEGGGDFFVRDEKTASKYKKMYSQYLSKHPDGL